MRKFCLRRIALFIILYLVFMISMFAVEVPLKFIKYPDELTEYYPRALFRLEKKFEKPTGEWVLPELKSDYPIYSFIKIGEKERLCILDRHYSHDIFYNRIYFDSNANQDLTDDPIIDGVVNKSDKQNCRVEFPAVDTTIEFDGEKLPYSFRPLAHTSRLDQIDNSTNIKMMIERYVMFWLRNNCCYSGEFQLDGQDYYVVIGDMNVNGRFDDKFGLRKIEPPPGYTYMRLYGQGDHLFISTKKELDPLDSQYLGDILLVKDKVFNIDISAARKKMTLIPLEENLAALELPIGTERLSLHSEDEKHCLNIYFPPKKIMVPRGKYRLLSYQTLKNDEQGDLWRLCAVGTRETPYFTTGGNGKSMLEYGEPYFPLIDAYYSGGRAGDAALMLSIMGSGREIVIDLSRVSGTKTRIRLSKDKRYLNRPKEPSYKIINADGKVTHQGTFKYG